MNNLKISTRLVILISILSAMLMAIGGVGLFGISQSNNALKTVYEDRTVPMAEISNIQRLLLRNRLRLDAALISPTPEVIKQSISEIETGTAEFSKEWEAYMATSLSPEEATMAKTFSESRAKFLQEGLKPAVEALRAGNLDEAKRLESGDHAGDSSGSREVTMAVGLKPSESATINLYCRTLPKPVEVM